MDKILSVVTFAKIISMYNIIFLVKAHSPVEI